VQSDTFQLAALDYNLKMLMLKNFDPAVTFLGGQSFLWEKRGDIYVLTEKDKCFVAKEDGKGVKVRAVLGDGEDIKSYFGSARKRALALKRLKKDKFLKRAIDALPGLYLLKQDFESVFLSFILSSNNSILRIRRSAQCLKESFGKSIATDLGEVKLFPGAERLSNASLKDLKACGLGYRAEFLKASAKDFAKDKDELENLRGLELVEALKNFKGVGDKVADCIAVFSGKADTFSPIDTHAKRILSELYELEFKKYNDYRKWFTERFGKDAALAGQFLFEYYRN